MARHLHPLPFLFLAVLVAAVPAHAIFHFDFRTDLVSPFGDGGSYSRHDTWRRAVLASKSRVARQTAALGKALGKEKEVSAADTAAAVAGTDGHWITVGIGTPPQRSNLVLDTGSHLIWTQCNMFGGPKAKQVEPIYDPGKSSSFQVLPCSSKLCPESQFNNCTKNRCIYKAEYVNLTSEGVLATDTFTFGVQSNVSVPLGFGCGTLSGAGLDGASGVMGLSWSNLSLITQLSVPKFSYCFTPFTERKTSPLMFGAMADLSKYKTTGPIQTVPLIRNPAMDTYYYVPLVGLSFGTKRLDVPADSLALKPDGSGGTIVDSASTVSYLVEPAFKELKKAVMETVKLPVANRSVLDYQLCFELPHGTPMEKVQQPPLRLHFEGGAEMVLPRDNYFQEPSPGLMCLAVGQTLASFVPNMISNVQQQNMHMLFDLRENKLSFAPTECGKL